MRLAICNEMFRDWSFEKTFAFVRDLGYQGVEIAPFTIAADAGEISVDTCRRIRDLARGSGLEITGLHWLLAGTNGLHLNSPDGAVRRRTADYLAVLARVCRELGGTIMVLGSPRQRTLLPGISLEQGHEFAAECLALALEQFDNPGVKIAIEPLGPEEGNFLVTAAEALQLVKRISDPRVGLNLDVKAMSTEAGPIEKIIEQAGDVLIHFHCNDPNRRGPGMGSVRYEPIIAALRKAGYDGWLSVEVFDETVSPEKMAAQSVRYLQDQLAAH
jgi:sugar phosphate isomerase/epimerase